ncbi:DUF1513 domain-containing protein [Salinarimonas sp. NSM]|uniref:DUF1513 domain-containing protein n=1 Tax=Salinarimonas sp. NSM TaxID=3458003 RepID=UPI00403606A9
MESASLDRRAVLRMAAGLGLAAGVGGCETHGGVALPAPAERPVPNGLADAAVYVPGYEPGAGTANGLPLVANRRIARAIRDTGKPYRLLSRIGMDGSVRQALLPAHAHDVAIAPDRSVGVLCGFEAADQVAFDPLTLDLVASAPAFGAGWRGGGHAAYLDGGARVLISERAPRRARDGGPVEAHFGRITIRDADTLRVRESYSTHGIDPHEIVLIEDGRYLVAANYGSLPRDGEGSLAVPRHVVEASVAIVDMADGRLLDKRVTSTRDLELRHLAAGGLSRIFAIQARLGGPADLARAAAGDGLAEGVDITSEPGIAYLSAPTLKLAADDRPGAMTVHEMGSAADRALMRHGLSIVYDPVHDQAIATFPSAHAVMAFDGATGDTVSRLDGRGVGLRFPCGITFLPDGVHYAVTGYWENLYVFERGSHRLVRDLCLYPTFLGHSHVTAA